MSTIREHLEAAVALEGEWPETVFGDVLDHVHAALKLLDESKIDILKSTFVEVPGREAEDVVQLDPARRYRSVFDPAP